FRAGFDARSENPAGSADPVRSTGRAGRGVLSLRQVSLHRQRKVARAVTARKPLTLMSAKERRVKTRPTGLLPATRKSKGSSLRSHPHPALRATFFRRREKGCSTDLPRREKGSSAGLPQAAEGRPTCPRARKEH